MPDLTGVRSTTIYPSAARTATPAAVDVSGGTRTAGVIVVIDVTAITSTPSVVFKIQGFDPVSGKTWDILTSAAIVATGTTVLAVRPGITVAANTAVSAAVPPNLRVIATHGNGNSITYTVALHTTS